MYRIKYSEEAREDLEKVFEYIADELLNPEAALDLIITIEKTVARRLDTFPYAYPIHNFLELLGMEYRRTIIKNFMIFYKVDEVPERVVTITYVSYKSRDVGQLILDY